jgi:PiT family inorganic phosphate transporter
MPGATVRWGVAGRMLMAWLLTLPAAGLVGAACFWLQNLVGGLAGGLVVFALLVLVSLALWVASRRKPVDHTNVNEAWDEKRAEGLEPVTGTTGTVEPPHVAPVEPVGSASPVSAVISVTPQGRGHA